MRSNAVKLASELGVELEFNGPWIRKVGEGKWKRYKQMYYHLYGRKRRGNKELKELTK